MRIKMEILIVTACVRLARKWINPDPGGCPDVRRVYWDTVQGQPLCQSGHFSAHNLARIIAMRKGLDVKRVNMPYIPNEHLCIDNNIHGKNKVEWPSLIYAGNLSLNLQRLK